MGQRRYRHSRVTAGHWCRVRILSRCFRAIWVSEGGVVREGGPDGLNLILADVDRLDAEMIEPVDVLVAHTSVAFRA